VLYLVALPSVCFVAVRPEMVTLSEYCLPLTVEPSPYARLKLLPSALDVDDFAGLYLVCPEHVEPQLLAGRKRSLLPVSKSTAP
jgi:hypothetical protein